MLAMGSGTYDYFLWGWSEVVMQMLLEHISYQSQQVFLMWEVLELVILWHLGKGHIFLKFGLYETGGKPE